MPTKSHASITALLEELTYAVQVSTCPTGFPFKAVPEIADRTALIRFTTVSGSSPTPDMFSIPIGEIR